MSKSMKSQPTWLRFVLVCLLCIALVTGVVLLIESLVS